MGHPPPRHKNTPFPSFFIHVWNRAFFSHKMYYLNSFRESTSPHNRQFVILISKSEQQVDDFVGDLTFQNHSKNTFCEIRSSRFWPAWTSYLHPRPEKTDLLSTCEIARFGGQVASGDHAGGACLVSSNELSMTYLSDTKKRRLMYCLCIYEIAFFISRNVSMAWFEQGNCLTPYCFNK